MNNRIAPVDKFLEQHSSMRTAAVLQVNFDPEPDTKPTEVGSESPRVRIAAIQHPV